MDDTRECELHLPEEATRPRCSQGRSHRAMRRGISRQHHCLAWSLLDGQADALVLVDCTGTLVYANEAAGTWVGKPAADLVGTAVWGLWPPGRREHLKLIFNQAIRTGEPIHFLDGQADRWREIVIHPITSRNGEVGAVAVQAHDASQRVCTEERLKRMILQLATIEEDERRRLAQDLHDDIGQRMTALLLRLKAVEKAVGCDGIAPQVSECVRDAEALMRQMRQVFFHLRPPPLAETPLPRALQTLCASFGQHTGLRVDLSCQPDLPPIPALQATAVYRLVQEGLHNAARHARATSLWINLDYTEGEITISMEDDGQGFDPAHTTGGMGLRGIRDRFLLLGGTFEVESAPGRGTRLAGSLPVAPAT